MARRRGRRFKQLLYDLKEKRRYWNLEHNALYNILWRARFGRGYGFVAGQTTQLMNHSTGGPPYPRAVRSKTYRGYGKPRIIPNAIYRVSHESRSLLRESVPYVKIYRYNPKRLYPKLNGYGDNGHRKVWASGESTYCTPSVTPYSSTAHARRRDVLMQ